MTGENRTGNGARDAALTRAEDAASRLQKGAGVRRRNLHADLGPELRRIWHIADDDPPQRVRAIVFLRLTAVLDALADRKLEPVVRTAYNIGPEPMAGQKGARMASLPRDRTERTYNRWLEQFHQRLADGLGGPQRVLTADEIRRAERRFAHRAPAGNGTAVTLISAFHCGADDVVTAFLADSWHAPADEDGVPVVVPLAARGSWLCVFPDRNALDDYRSATGAPWRFAVSRPGREFAKCARARPEPTGVLVNPSSARGTGAEAAFSLPHSVLTGLVIDPPGPADPRGLAR
ncbi:hypothetical protein [Amycolatopsis sp. cmx-4-68]|uniref:hypothetical protein n=1 Tax=Amycolatopsis sp. cmx-4-68 TaxID=2790938 RepID=UPI00397B7640